MPAHPCEPIAYAPRCSAVHINELHSLPAELGRLPLEAVSLFKNKLVTLPPELLLGLAGTCCRLGLYENELREVPKEIGKLSLLQEL